jgi:hypothetical protein
MKQFLKSDHTEPSNHILKNNLWFPITPLLENNKIDELVAVEIFVHETPDGSAPFGYTNWVFDATNKKYTREKIGTEAEITAKLAEDELVSWRESTSIPKLYCKLALMQAGHWDNVLVAIENLTPAQQLFFAEAPTWRRVHEIIMQMAIVLELSDTQLDDLFKLAQQIQEQNA